MAKSIVNVAPLRDVAVGDLSPTQSVTIDAQASRVKLSFSRNGWPGLGPKVPVLRAQAWISYDGAVTWGLLAGFTAGGGVISATESAVSTFIKPERGFPRQIKVTGKAMAIISTQIDFTVS